MEEFHAINLLIDLLQIWRKNSFTYWARAILKDAPIILLDEATASLDPENEVAVQDAISNLIKNKTVIVVAHKLKNVVGANKIVVLDKGKIVEQGKHEELLSLGGVYKSLWDYQGK